MPHGPLGDLHRGGPIPDNVATAQHAVELAGRIGNDGAQRWQIRVDVAQDEKSQMAGSKTISMS
jgi:hypothetical protein